MNREQVLETYRQMYDEAGLWDRDPWIYLMKEDRRLRSEGKQGVILNLEETQRRTEECMSRNPDGGRSRRSETTS